MLKKRINYWYMRSAAKLGHKLSSDWYKTLGSFERPTSEQMNVIAIPIEKKVDAPTQFILPKDIMFALIDKAACVGIIHKCTCRTSAGCKDYPQETGCVVLGSTVETLDPSIGRIVTKDEAKEYVVGSLDLGCTPAYRIIRGTRRCIALITRSCWCCAFAASAAALCATRQRLPLGWKTRFIATRTSCRL